MKTLETYIKLNYLKISNSTFGDDYLILNINFNPIQKDVYYKSYVISSYFRAIKLYQKKLIF